MCAFCRGALTPIVYSRVVDDVLLGMHKSGKIILSGPEERYADHPKSYCMLCQEPSTIEVPIDKVLVLD
jgi:hypothetical protein